MSSWSADIFSALFAFVLSVYRKIYDYLQFVKSIAIGKGDEGRGGAELSALSVFQSNIAANTSVRNMLKQKGFI